MRKPENFSLSKIKLLKGGGVEVSFSETITKDGITDTKNWVLKNTENPHPDLVDKINELKIYLAKCYNLDLLVNLTKNKGLTHKEEEGFKAVEKIMNKVFFEQLKKISISGVSINGEIDNDKDKRSVVIMATQLMENGSKTALNSPRIKLANDQFKFEADVQDIVNDLQEEASAYLFDGKKAQLSMFDEVPENLKKVS